MRSRSSGGCRLMMINTWITHAIKRPPKTQYIMIGTPNGDAGGIKLATMVKYIARERMTVIEIPALSPQNTNTACVTLKILA